MRVHIKVLQGCALMNHTRPLCHSCLLTTTHLVCLELSKLNLYHTPLSASTPLQQTMLTTLLEQVVVDNQQAKLVLAGISDNVGVEIGSTQWLLSLEGPQVITTML